MDIRYLPKFIVFTESLLILMDQVVPHLSVIRDPIPGTRLAFTGDKLGLVSCLFWFVYTKHPSIYTKHPYPSVSAVLIYALRYRVT